MQFWLNRPVQGELRSMTIRAHEICLLAFMAVNAWAQTPPQPPGSVTGYVYCADTNAPARFARVMVEPAEDLDDSDSKTSANALGARISSISGVQTRLDGSFLIENLTPGRYYVLAEMPGYLSPLAEINPTDVGNRMTNDVKERLRAVLQSVIVTADRETRLDFRLEKGAALSGRILYDDGAPVVDVPVSLLRKDKNGSWQPVSNIVQERFSSQQTTDDQGRYRIASLPAGEYLVSVELRWISVTVTGDALGEGAFGYRGSGVSARVYSGDTARRRDAKAISLRKGEERSGVDVIAPISRLYTVSGRVIAERDGHGLNVGLVTLVDAFDGTVMNQAYLRDASGRFEIDLVPEGDYILKISGASDSVHETGGSLSTGGIYSRMKPIHSYADAEQRVSVRGNVADIVVKMAEKEAGGQKQSAED